MSQQGDPLAAMSRNLFSSASDHKSNFFPVCSEFAFKTSSSVSVTMPLI